MVIYENKWFARDLRRVASKEPYHLGGTASVFQSKGICGSQATTLLLPERYGGEYVVCSYSEAVMSPVTNSKMAKGLKRTRNQMGLKNQVLLVWMPGNEKAYRLARFGSMTRSCGVEPYLPSRSSCTTRGWRVGYALECASRWSAYDGGKYSKRLFPVPNERWTGELLVLNRFSIRRVVGAITENGRLHKCLVKMELTENPAFDCGFEEETDVHVICEWQKFFALRLSTMSSYVLGSLDVPKLWPAALNRFFVGTGRF